MRQRDAEHRALAHLALQVNGAAVQRHDMLDDGQPQSGTARLPGASFVHPVEPFKYPVLGFRRDADAGVRDSDGHRIIHIFHQYIYISTGMIIFDAIFRQVEDVLAEEEVILKIAVYHRGSIRQLGEEVLIPQWGGLVKTCVAGEEWVDFMDASVDKGNALRTLQQVFGVAKEETMAFGDNTNDIGLMQAAGLSYAVENARPEVKAAARFTCPSYLEKGVWKTIMERCGKES